MAGADQCGRGRDAPSHAELPTQPVSQPRVEVDLNDDGDREEADDHRLRQDLLPLKPEEEHEGRQQGNEGDRLEGFQHPRQGVRAGGLQGRPPG